METVSGYLGRLTTGNSAYIRDVDTGTRLGPGEVGEICVKTMICMKVTVKENYTEGETGSSTKLKFHI